MTELVCLGFFPGDQDPNTGSNITSRGVLWTQTESHRNWSEASGNNKHRICTRVKLPCIQVLDMDVTGSKVTGYCAVGVRDKLSGTGSEMLHNQSKRMSNCYPKCTECNELKNCVANYKELNMFSMEKYLY